MGNEKSKSLTESGVKYISYYLLLQFYVIFILMICSLSLFFSKEASAFFLAFVILELIIFILPIISLINLYNGKNEFGQKHSYNVTFGLILVIIYFAILLVKLIVSKGLFGGSSIISLVTSDFSAPFITQFIIVFSLSIVSRVFFGKAFIYLISELITEDEKKNLQKNYKYLIIGPLTLEITGLIALRSFYKNYKAVYQRIYEGKLKPAVTAPCPNCNRDIPIDSRVCLYCGSKFEENPDAKIDLALRIEAPKQQSNLPHGYTPVKGPTEEQKRKVIFIIGTIVVVIIVLAAIYLIIKYITS